MTAYPYPSQIALDVNGDLVTAGTGQVYAQSDTTFTTPLSITDETGAPKASVAISSIGATEFFSVVDHGTVWWKSGALPAVLLTSYLGFALAASSAQAAAEAAQVAAENAEDQVFATPDTQVAGFVSTNGSATNDAVDALIAAAIAQIGDGYVTGPTDRKLAVVAGVIRNDGSPEYWEAINDAGHSPVNIDAVTTSTTTITIDYTSLGATKVGTFIVVPDDTLAGYGYVAGASVGLTSSVITLSQARPFADYVSYNGSAWVSQTGVFSLSFSAGVLTATHPTIPGNSFEASVTSRDGALVAVADGNSATALTLKWRDWAGAVQTTASTNMKAYITHGANGPLNPQQVTTAVYPGSNLWVLGIFEVA